MHPFAFRHLFQFEEDKLIDRDGEEHSLQPDKQDEPQHDLRAQP
jgi:hypothetical protein